MLARFTGSIRIVFLILAFCCNIPITNAASTPEDLLLRGITNGKYIHNAGNTKYYLCGTKDRSQHFIAALHDVDESSPVYERSISFESRDGFYVDTYYYPDEMLEHFKKHLAPAIASQLPAIAQIDVIHYNSRFLLNPGKERANRTRGVIESPLTSTTFKRTDDGWVFATEQVTLPDRNDYISVGDALKHRSIYTTDLDAEMAKIRKAEAVRIAKIEKLIKDEMASRKLGIVYKSDRFWEKFPYLTTARKVFDGDFDGLKYSASFMEAYVNIQSAYGSTCREYLPAIVDKRKYTSQTIKKNVYGEVLERETPVVTEIFMDPRFSTKFDEYSHSAKLKAYLLKKETHLISKTLSGEYTKGIYVDFEGITNMVLEYSGSYQMSKLAQEAGCDSATMYQLRENIYRVAHDMPSLQEAKIAIKGAEKESDPAREFITVAD